MAKRRMAALDHGYTAHSLGLTIGSCALKYVRIWAEGSPHDLKDDLGKRGYRWNDGSDGRPRSWHVEIDEGLLDAEMRFLRTEIYC